MVRRLAHFSDPRLDAQVEQLIKHGNATQEAITEHVSRRDNPHKVTVEQIGAVPVSEKGQPNGVATLGADGKVLADQLPPASTPMVVHGNEWHDPAFETPDGAQAKADTAQAAMQANLDAHAALTVAHGATSTATAGRIIIRDDTGRAKVAAPVEADDIARKDTVDAHASRTDNPHATTAQQVGAAPLSHVGAGGGAHVAASSSLAGFMSPADKAKLDSIQSGAEVNQNAFSKILVGATTIEADSKTDSLGFVAGTNIALTPDTANDTVTIAVTGTVASAATADTVDGKHASDLALVGHGHTGGADGSQIGTSGLQDGAVTDAKVGSRTADQAQTPTGSTGTLTQLFSWIANRLRAITGATNWFDAPAATLAAIWAKFNASTGHKHTGAADDAPQVDYANIANKPTSFTPVAHKTSHASGGSDALTPGDIGAVAKSGDTMTGRLTAPSYGSKDTRSVATAPGDYDGELRLQFKSLSAVGLTGIASGAYCQLIGYRAWSDDSGGHAHELAFADDGNVYYRHGTEASGWGPWSKFWHESNDGPLTGLAADVVDGYHANTTIVAGMIPVRDQNGKVPGDITGGSQNSDAVDGKHATDFVWNLGSTPSIQAGADASKPAAGTAGRLYIATDTQTIYRDSGSAWVKAAVVKWDSIDGKPSSFTPSAHTHAGTDITSQVANADAVDGLHVTGSSTPGLRKITISTATPSGGADGDVWIVYS